MNFRRLFCDTNHNYSVVTRRQHSNLDCEPAMYDPKLKTNRFCLSVYLHQDTVFFGIFFCFSPSWQSTNQPKLVTSPAHTSVSKGTYFKQKISIKCSILRTFSHNLCISLFTTVVNKASESLYISTSIASGCLTLYSFQYPILIKRTLCILERVTSWEDVKR